MLRTSAGLLFGLALLSSSASAHGSLQYRLTALQPDPAPTAPEIFQVADLNDKGQVLLTRFFDGRLRAYLWQKGRLVELTDQINPNSSQIIARAMNDRTAIVGQDQLQGFLLFHGRVSAVDPGSGTPVTPIDINNRGQILGSTDFVETPGEESFLMRGRKVSMLEPLPGDFGTFVLSLNDRGVVAGQSLGTEAVRAAIWERGTVMEIAVPADTRSAAAYAINNRNQLLVSLSHFDGSSQQFVWENGELIELQSFSVSFPQVVAASMNDCGFIVGTAIPTPFTPPAARATLWRNKMPVDLNSLISDTDPLKPFVTLNLGLRINDRGEIVAMGIDSRVPQQSLYFVAPIKTHHARRRQECHAPASGSSG